MTLKAGNIFKTLKYCNLRYEPFQLLQVKCWAYGSRLRLLAVLNYTFTVCIVLLYIFFPLSLFRALRTNTVSCLIDENAVTSFFTCVCQSEVNFNSLWWLCYEIPANWKWKEWCDDRMALFHLWNVPMFPHVKMQICCSNCY